MSVRALRTSPSILTMRTFTPAGGCFLDVPVGVSDGIEKGVDTTVIQKPRGFHGVYVFRLHISLGESRRGENIQGVLKVSGTGITQVDAFSLKVRHRFNPALNAGHQGNRLGMNGEYRAQLLLGTALFPFSKTV